MGENIEFVPALVHIISSRAPIKIFSFPVLSLDTHFELKVLQ